MNVEIASQRQSLSPELRPQTLEELLDISPNELSRVDVGRSHLLCSTGLPGTERMDIEASLRVLDQWAQGVGEMTASSFHLLDEHHDLLEGSEPLLRMYCLTRFLWHYCKIEYVEEERDLEVDADWSDASRHMLFGLISHKRHGTCSSLPYLLVSVGRRLDYPLRIVHSPGHVFCRWDGEDHENKLWRERRNVEFSGDFHVPPDEHYYHSPAEWTAETRLLEQRRAIPLYLRSITPAEEVADALVQRAYALEAHDRFTETMAAYHAANRLAPHNDEYTYFAKVAHQGFLDRLLKPWGLDGFHYCQLVERRVRGELVKLPWEGNHPVEADSPFTNVQREILEQAENAVVVRLANAQTKSRQATLTTIR